MKRLRQAIRLLKQEVSAWGTQLPRATNVTGTAAVEVYLETRHGRVTLGTLSKEGQEFVFRYDPDFAHGESSKPISAFPDLEREYRTEELWPFFAVRVPPVERDDVREAMQRRHIPEKDILRLLAELSGRGVSSPYRFAMAGRAG